MLRRFIRIDAELFEAVDLTLDHMGRGGIYDHLGGGICRYSTDREWLVPHFEKMLYDQAMALWVFAEAYGRFRDRWYAEIADGVVASLERDFSEARGLYVSAFDADTNHEEGATYRIVFRQDQTKLADSKLTVARGGRAVVGGMDGEAAPYVFVFVQPDPPHALCLSGAACHDILYFP